MPMHYAQGVDRSGFTASKGRMYVYSDSYVDADTIIIRYAIKIDELLNAIMNSHNKAVESAYFLELIEPLKKYSTSSLCEIEITVNADALLKKEVGVFAIEQDYYFSDKAPSIQMESKNFVKARKEIAKVCLAAGAEPGEYHGREATHVIRAMQTAIVSVFENQIAQFNRDSLHYRALDYYTTQLHGTIINLKRYMSFNDLDPIVQQEFEEKTRNTREEYRRNLRTAQYLLESNLAIHHRDSSTDCDKDEFVDLLAFADWLVVLQDNADTCYFRDFDLSIEIDSDYKVATVLSEFSELQYEEMLLRKYEQEDYGIKNDETDKIFLIQSINAFIEDTGVDMRILISLLEYLQLEVTNKGFAEEIYPNIFNVSKGELISDFVELISEPKNGDYEKVERCLEFITLDTNKLKLLGGTIRDVLPVWDREKRDNRFDVRPLIVHDSMCIFSPAVMKQLATSWKSGFTEWYLPYETGLERVKAELAIWKKRYEDEMVQDIADVFRRNGFSIVLPEIELHSRYPLNGFPNDLGDYDIIAVNKSKAEIWLIESKVLQKVGSIFEDQMLQDRFFFKKRLDEKFQRRIDYAVNNTGRIIMALGVEDKTYSIIPYMVTNKPFTSRYKVLKFPIITYHELVRLLEEI